MAIVTVTSNEITSTTSSSITALSGSPITFTINVSSVNVYGMYYDSVQSVIITLTKDGSIIASNEVIVDNSTFTIDISSYIHGWFVSKNYDCSSLENLKNAVSEEAFTLSISYKAKRNYTSPDTTGIYESNSDVNIDGTGKWYISIFAIEGALTEYAIYNHGAISRDSFGPTYNYSLKPFSMETVNKDEVPYPNTGRSYFQESFHNYRRKRMWFINSLGVLESVSLMTLEDEYIKYTTKVHKLYKDASFEYNPNISTSKSSRVSWKMSSGYCTKDWMEWFAGEFAFAKHVWLENNDGSLIPVSITTDSATVYDKSKGTLGSVDFTVKSCISSNI